MRPTRLLAVVTLFAGWAFAQSGTDRLARKRVYFLKDGKHRQWCGYADESRLKAQMQSLGAMVVGGVDYANGRVSVVHITEIDETEDWEVNDEYSVADNESVRALKRTINITPEDTSEDQVFRIEDGKAIKLRSVYVELRSGKPTRKRIDWFKPPPVITSLRAFPFWTLIATKRQTVWANGEACVPDVSK